MKHQARKRFGQNFLHDQNIIQKIIAAISPKPEQAVVEIGPGLGAITFELLKIVNQLDVVEIDHDLAANLNNLEHYQNQLTVHQSDVLKFDFSSLNKDALRIVGNLPYNISTPLCFHLLQYASQVSDMHFMLQKEVVERMAADVNTSAYGRLSVMMQYYCDVSLLFTVPPTAFHPKPKVESAIVRLVPYQNKPAQANDEAMLADLVKQAFAHPRKTLRNNLKSFCSLEKIESAGIEPSARPATLSVADYVNLVNGDL